VFTALFRWLPLALILCAALWLRTHELARRPMHADEANQAVKLGELLEAGHYAFDPNDHHGPTLYYAAVPAAWIRGERSLARLSETTVRLVPAVFGTIAVWLLIAIGTPLCRVEAKPDLQPSMATCWPALTAGAFLAVSPPAVYYSRYFIQETLLATFFLAAVFSAQKWWRSGLTRWGVGAGIAAGLMQATKASAPLFLVVAIIAVAFAGRRTRPATRRPRRDAAFALVAAFATAALLYSSFGTHPAGVRDAFGAYAQAFTRFGGEAPPTGHEKPWWYYLKLFGLFREGGFVWHQIAFTALAGFGLVAAFARKHAFERGVANYGFVIFALFSVFAYKTPWHAVHFVSPLALLGAIALCAIGRWRGGRLLAVAVTIGVLATLAQQTRLVSFLRPADQRNPYAYVHSSFDVLKYHAAAEAAVAAFPDQPIRVISEEYWPLPWYLRTFSRVGFHSTPPEDCDGALVITSIAQADAVRSRLRGTYRESFLGLRPGVVMILFAREPAAEPIRRP
jgi:uncharacterized protein (TIGR03663 family)